MCPGAAAGAQGSPAPPGCGGSVCPSLCPRIWDETPAVPGRPFLLGPGSVRLKPVQGAGGSADFLQRGTPSGDSSYSQGSPNPPRGTAPATPVTGVHRPSGVPVSAERTSGPGFQGRAVTEEERVPESVPVAYSLLSTAKVFKPELVFS